MTKTVKYSKLSFLTFTHFIFLQEFLFVEMSSPEELEAVLQCACHPYQADVVPVSSPLLWLRSGGPLQTQTGPDAQRVSLPPVSGKQLSPAELAAEIAALTTVSTGTTVCT